NLDSYHPPCCAVRVLDADLITRRVIAKINPKVTPRARDAGVQVQPGAPQTEPENPLNARAVHPPRGPGVPRPPAATDVRRLGVNVPRNYIGLDLITVNTGARAPMIDRIQQGKEFTRFVSVAEGREREHRPDRRVRVLAAVFAHAGQVPFDVPRVPGRAIEWRGKEKDKPVAATNQILFHRCHRPHTAGRLGRPGDHAPGLGDRVDATFTIRDRTQRRAIVKVRAAIPIAVPGFSLERRLERPHMPTPRLGTLAFPAGFRQP